MMMMEERKTRTKQRRRRKNEEKKEKKKEVSIGEKIKNKQEKSWTSCNEAAYIPVMATFSKARRRKKPNKPVGDLFFCSSGMEAKKEEEKKTLGAS